MYHVYKQYLELDKRIKERLEYPRLCEDERKEVVKMQKENYNKIDNMLTRMNKIGMQIGKKTIEYEY